MSVKNLRQQQIFDNFGFADYLGGNGIEGGGGNYDPTYGARPAPSPTYPSGSIIDEDVGRLPSLMASSQKPDPIEEANAMLSRFYTPETDATDAYNEFLQNVPERNDPGFLRRLVASGQAVGNKYMNQPGGIEAAEKTMYAPYLRDMAEWNTKAEPLYKAAQLENTANANERQVAGSMSTYLLGQQKIDQQREEAAGKAQTAQEGIDQRNRTAELAYKRAIDTAKINAVSREGDIWNFSGPTAKFTRNGKEYDTGVPVENIDQVTQIDLQSRGQIGPRDTNTYVDPKGTPGRIDPMSGQYETVPGAPAGGVARPDTAGGPNVSPVVQRNMKFQELYDSRQDLRKYLIPPTTTNGSWQLNPPKADIDPSWMPFSTLQMDPKKQQEFEEVKRLLGVTGNEAAPTEIPEDPDELGTRSQPSGTGTATARVRHPDGRTGTWDYSKGPLPPGFTVIR